MRPHQLIRPRIHRIPIAQHHSFQLTALFRSQKLRTYNCITMNMDKRRRQCGQPQRHNLVMMVVCKFRVEDFAVLKFDRKRSRRCRTGVVDFCRISIHCLRRGQELSRPDMLEKRSGIEHLFNAGFLQSTRQPRKHTCRRC